MGTRSTKILLLLVDDVVIADASSPYLAQAPILAGQQLLRWCGGRRWVWQ
ncbi:hypothetical protein [Thermocoleostomius sinensis]|uniref:Uncharacterized protein n=1 Tax=Thermocoleostomius sinensis A174 TaxID=2016057 RepID=A0A9E8ZCK9_9CYAN|nr:hypothetical protein [Thermocoleostomius sinensis]WAL60427.1 hypothetical protein OXH18_00085 [Thermocoleostomius sinensis A174]